MLIYLQMLDGPEERSKFEQVYHHYKGLMFYTANQILHNEQDAEDTVHEAFLSIAKNLQKISRVDCPETKSYIVTIVENRAIDLYRKKSRHPVGELLEEAQGLTVEYEGDDGLARCILKLPARDREWLLLRFDQGYSVKETAKFMGISMAAAYKLEQRAKDKLEALCREEGVL